jgi:ribosomal protein S27AE
MKNGLCPMCQSNDVFMTDNDDNLGENGSLMFSGFVGREMGSYHSDLYVCLNCGYMGKHQELIFLQNAKGWKKAA